MHSMNFNFLCPGPSAPAARSVGIIGAGPSGLAAAGHLSCLGYQVDVYDKLPKPGGLMLFGIPGHRIPRERVASATRHMERDYGVIFHTQTKICCSAPMFEEEGDHFCKEILGLKDLVMRHDASIICTGSWKSRKMGIEGENLPGVYSGLEFLFPIRAVRYASARVKAPDVAGKAVAVIGAGHSAVDAAHGAVHLGAASVTMLYRRTAKEAPCGSYEIERLKDMGVAWVEKAAPTRVLGEDRVTGLEYSRGGGSVTLPVDAVVAAIGEIATPPFARELGLEEVRKGEVHWLHMTAIENVFVAGDALTGPSKIGKAVYSGLRAARSLANWLDLKAQDRLNEYAYDDLVSKDEPVIRK
ncbi:FAD-dependent oxidoreductase [Fundidesulfovibrio terrae]|uniref:FAD-dependent oxidoreductase n=1 Tax=Fundidesulfovibrio terrae TaxID=2922866 RepID=UPI003C2AFD85